MQSPITFDLQSPDETAQLAQHLGALLAPGDVVLLSGDIGAGKTHFARSLILSLLPEPEDVPSPTFTLVQTYLSPLAEIWHADLYRLTDADEAEELGLTEAFETAICLVEWPDRLEELAPKTALYLDFKAMAEDEARTLKISWEAGDWAHRLQDCLT